MTDSTYATAPFDHAKADIILRSSDNVDFRVFKLFLSLASSFFETLFDIPQPSDVGADQEIKDGLVVIPVTENSKIVDTLLRFCYPCTLAEDPTLEVLQDAVEVLEAARKYSLDAIETKARKAIMTSPILLAEPVRCFAIARQGRLQEETKLAARHTLSHPLVPEWFQEIESMTAADLLALLTYHQRCGEAVFALRADQSWIESHYGAAQTCNWFLRRSEDGWSSGNVTSCKCQISTTSRALFHYQPVQWWETFMDEVFAGLRGKPCSATVHAASETTIRAVKARNCPTCASTVTEGMREFANVLEGKVNETVSQIELQFF